MKSLLALLFLLAPGLNQQDNLITLSDAEKIFGESGKVFENLTENTDNVKVRKTTFRANSNDPVKGGTINLYYMYEEYKYDSSAKRVYNDIMVSNQTHEGFEPLKGIGDEAYYHTDKENFYFILARKGVKMIRMKLNRVTSKSNESEFKKISQRIVAKM